MALPAATSWVSMGPCLLLVSGSTSKVERVSVRILNHKLGNAPGTVGDAFNDLHASFLNLPESGMDVAHANMDVKVMPGSGSSTSLR